MYITYGTNSYGQVSSHADELYVFNCFFMTVRSAFNQPGKSTHYYMGERDPAKHSSKDFAARFSAHCVEDSWLSGGSLGSAASRRMATTMCMLSRPSSRAWPSA